MVKVHVSGGRSLGPPDVGRMVPSGERGKQILRKRENPKTTKER